MQPMQSIWIPYFIGPHMDLNQHLQDHKRKLYQWAIFRFEIHKHTHALTPIKYFWIELYFAGPRKNEEY